MNHNTFGSEELDLIKKCKYRGVDSYTSTCSIGRGDLLEGEYSTFENCLKCVYNNSGEQATPNFAEKMSTFMRSVALFANSGFSIVESEVRKERMSVCESCEHFDVNKNKCNKCGCYLKVKTAFSHESCPVKKWGAVTQKQPQQHQHPQGVVEVIQPEAMEGTKGRCGSCDKIVGELMSEPPSL